ncbi:GNAT family N-acetyltransferase [Clostridium sp.]|uniref:GNAT family N-acetyltransferase n=1 Tax=Clostridium sp. TaxID=1506 RepID=UPI003217269D
MRIQLRRNLINQIENLFQFKIYELVLEGAELERKLNIYLSRFIEGTLDPDLSGKKPDKFIENLKNNVLGDFSKRYIITAQCNDEVIGILIALPGRKNEMHIYSLHVAATYRNKGVASTLLATCINDMNTKNIEDIIIDVHIDNKPAYILYKKFGFVEVDNKI